MKENLFILCGQNQNITGDILETPGLFVALTKTKIQYGLENIQIPTAKITLWNPSTLSKFTAYSDVECAFVNIGIFTSSSFLPSGTYALSLLESTTTFDETAIAIARQLANNQNFNPIIFPNLEEKT